MLIHFWCPQPLAAQVSSWDPDAEPERFATSVGHSFLELYVRLARTGADAALGRTPPRRPALAVLPAPLLRKHPANLEQALRAIVRARGRSVLIRGDTPLAWKLPVTPTVELMPYRAVAVAVEPNQRWLPQRGLVPRRRETVDRIATVAIKCNSVTLPDGLRDPELLAALEQEGIRVWIDMPSETDGSDQRWHDFADVDATLCARTPSVGRELDRRQARDEADQQLGRRRDPDRRPGGGVRRARRGGRRRLLRRLAAGAAGTLRRLNDDPQLLRRLHEGVRARQREFSPERVLELWRKMLEEVAATAPPDRRAAQRAAAAAVRVRGARLRDHVRLALVLRARRWLAAARASASGAP